MRVTESALMHQLSSNVDTSSSNFQTLQNELATGKQINEPSDNPSGASQAMTITSLLTNISQYQTDATSATGLLKYTDSQLNSVTELVQQARTIGVAAASTGTQDSDSQTTNAAQIGDILTQLTTLANSTYAGANIFSGTRTTTNAYTPGDDTYTYQGNDQPVTATIGAGQTVQVNTPGDTVFQPIFTALKQLQADITNGDGDSISDNDLSSIDTALGTLSQTRANVGVRIDDIANNTSLLQTSQQNYQTRLSGIEDVDIATVYAQLQVAQNVYQASLVSTSKSLQYSLASYLQ